MNARIPICLLCLTLVACAESELAPEGNNGRVESDAGTVVDLGAANNANNTSTMDAGTPTDSGEEMDSGPSDMGSVTDSGTDAGSEEDMGSDAGMTNDPCPGVPSGQGWEAVGGAISALPGGTDSLIPDIAIDSECRPIIAFHEAAVGEEENVFVYRWTGTAWQRLGNAIDATNQTDKWTTGVRIETFGTDIYIAWAEITLDNSVSVFVAKWTGSQWQILGDTAASGLLSFDMSLVIDSAGRPVAAWNARDGFNMPTQVRVARWEDPNWVSIGGALKNDPSKPAASAQGPELVFDADGNLVVAWFEDNYIHTRRWTGTTWAPVNGAPIDAVMDPSGTFDANLALKPTGEILYGWREAAGSTNVYVEAWDGNSFSVIANTLDAEPETGGRTNTESLDIAADSQGRTVIVFNEPITNGGRNRVHVFRHDSTGLGRLGAGILDVNVGDTGAKSPQVAIDAADRAYVVFVERGTQSDDVHIWRWTD